MYRKKYPCVRQHDQSDCAAAALGSICQYYKKDLSITKIRDVIGTDAYGTTVKGIIDGALELGFDAKGVRILHEDITSNYTLPAIAHIITEEKLPHFVVVYKISKGRIYYSDPARGNIKETVENFLNLFTGAMILLIPKTTFEIEKRNRPKITTIFTKVIWPQKKLLLTTILLSFLLSILGIFASLFSKVLFDEIIPYEMKNKLFVFIILFGIVALIQMFLSGLREYVITYLSRKIDVPILLGYYKHVLLLPYRFFSQRKVGDILTRFQDAMTIKDIFTTVSVSLVLDICIASITGIALYMIHKTLFGIIIFMIFLDIFLLYIFKKPYKVLNIDQMEATSTLNSQLIESLKNIETVKAHHAETQQLEYLEQKYIRVLELTYKERIVQIFQTMFSGGIQTLGQLIFMGVGGIAIMNGNLSIGTLIVFQTLSGYFTQPIQNLVSLQLTFQEAQISINRLNEIMEIEEEAEEETLILDKKISGDIKFENLSFRYGSRAPILHNISFEIKKGSTIALVGESGAGKSTLAKLLLRYYVPTEGKLLFDGINSIDIHPYTLRSQIGYVPQDVELFSGTILENIRIGKDDATYEDVIRASKKAGAHTFIDKLPARYLSKLDEDGGNLSGGERQRIAIARALLKDPEIYIFDEATSNLDSYSEEYIQNMMFHYTKGKTSIIIAHRLSTILRAETILVMHKGEIIEFGTHEELMAQRGMYNNMIQKQYGCILESSNTMNLNINKTNTFSERRMKNVEEEMIYE